MDALFDMYFMDNHGMTVFEYVSGVLGLDADFIISSSS